MTSNDIEYFRLCVRLGLVHPPLLEVGAAKVQLSAGMPNVCDIARGLGIEPALGADIQGAPGVDIQSDFSLDATAFGRPWAHGVFRTVVVFNVLEHTFDPGLVLRNALSCTERDGTLLVVAPSVWPIHSHPSDMVRLLPNWFEAFARSERLELIGDAFVWLSQFGLTPICSPPEREYQLPSYSTLGRKNNAWKYWVSRFVHRALNTYGRSHAFTHAAIGAAFRRVPVL